MKCPLMVSYQLLPERGMDFVLGNCVRRECAMYDVLFQRCRWAPTPGVGQEPRTILSLEFLHKVLGMLKDKRILTAVKTLEQEVKRLEQPPRK